MVSNNKRPVESFLVALPAATTIPVTGTLSNSSTGNVNLTNGQLGIVSMSSFGTVALNAFTDATPTVTEAPVIALYQGTAASAGINTSSATYPLWVRPFEKTSNINGVNNRVTVTRQDYRLGKHNIWTVGVPSSATTGAVNVLDNTDYRMTIAFNGARVDNQFSRHTVASTTIQKTTPDFTNLASTYPLPIDWICTQFAYEINRNSEYFLLASRFQGSDPMIAFTVGIANSGPAGGAAGTAISGIAAGDSFTVFTYNGVARSIVFTQSMVDSIQAAATASSFTHLLSIDLANAGTATGGTATGVMIMGLDSRLAYIDYIPQVKTRLRIGLKSGFDFTTVSSLESVQADEGQGDSRSLELLYQATAGQRKYAQRHVQDPVIKFPSPIVDGQAYVVYNILHSKSEQIDTSNVSVSPFREIICVPRYSTGTTAHPAIALLNTALNAWLDSSGNPRIAVL